VSNYDPDFEVMARSNALLFGDFNFGYDSSREQQGAIALTHKRASLVIAGSFDDIRAFARNGVYYRMKLTPFLLHY
jgi:homoaconitate hydratase